MAFTPDDTGSLTLEKKAALGSGRSFWAAGGIGGVPTVLVSDGPHGLRKQEGAGDHMGLGRSVPATCFPPAAGLAQTWDLAIVEQVGQALGHECRVEGVGVLLGPGINIRRDPRGGRNFEYYSEDPFLSGALGSAWVRGVQSQGVGTSLKHFAANNAEHDRMRASSDINERPLREIYLRAFGRVVTDEQPWTVMCSYNRINGVYAAENRWLLTQVLRDEWGFTGAVVSDWGAVPDRVAAVAAGLDLEMPGPAQVHDDQVVAAVAAGTLDPGHVDRAARKVAELAAKAAAAGGPSGFLDVDRHHELAREAARRAIVLLKNDGDVLPLATDTSVAVIGESAQSPRYQGGGSSHVNPTRVDIPLDEIRARVTGADVTFALGFTTDGSGDAAALRDEAVAAARAADVAVVFLGLAARQESEGFDREHIELPDDQLELLAAVVAAQPRTVVVLSHGGVVRLAPVVDAVPAILDGALLGQGGGAALADALSGLVNPSGRLTETVPERVEDAPSFLDFPGEHYHVRYAEGLHVGYRGYDARRLAVTFPFGHGLSYTRFEHSDLTVRGTGDGLTVAVTVTNAGDRAGREVVQVYVGLATSSVTRAPRELKGFAGVTLEPGASATVSVPVRREDLAYWDVRVRRWVVEGGKYLVEVGASSRDIRLSADVDVDGDDLRVPVTAETTIGELMSDLSTAAALAPLFASMSGAAASEDGGDLGTDMARMIGSIPVGRMPAGDTAHNELLAQILAAAGATDTDEPAEASAR